MSTYDKGPLYSWENIGQAVKEAKTKGELIESDTLRAGHYWVGDFNNAWEHSPGIVYYWIGPHRQDARGYWRAPVSYISDPTDPDYNNYFEPNFNVTPDGSRNRYILLRPEMSNEYGDVHP